MMILEYIQAALINAEYEIIDGDQYYGEIPELPGVWASAASLEECRQSLIDVLEEWILLKIKKGQKIPTIDNHSILGPEEIAISE